VARFLALLSCERTAVAPRLGLTEPVELKNKNAYHYSILAASALGTMLGLENGTPFWKQRISYLLLPEILPYCDESALGPILSIAHITCCVSLPGIGRDRLHDIASVLVNGLDMFASPVVLERNMSASAKSHLLRRSKLVVLASLLKVTSLSLNSVSIPSTVFYGKWKISFV